MTRVDNPFPANELFVQGLEFQNLGDILTRILIRYLENTIFSIR